MKYALVLLSFVLLSVSAYSADGYKIGDKVADFSLKNIDGKMIKLSDYKDQEGVIVIFSCNHCPYVKMYEDRMIGLDKNFAKIGFPLLALNPNDPAQFPTDDFESMKLRAKEKGFEFPYLLDEGGSVAKKFGATKTPHVFLLNKEMKVVYIGAIDDNAREANNVEVKYLENAIRAIKEGTNPDPNSTKAIGCTIKWK